MKIFLLFLNMNIKKNVYVPYLIIVIPSSFFFSVNVFARVRIFPTYVLKLDSGELEETENSVSLTHHRKFVCCIALIAHPLHPFYTDRATGTTLQR